jgi:lipid-A-disaccharide synthase-like uncharacterized protein
VKWWINVKGFELWPRRWWFNSHIGYLMIMIYMIKNNHDDVTRIIKNIYTNINHRFDVFGSLEIYGQSNKNKIFFISKIVVQTIHNLMQKKMQVISCGSNAK